MSFLYIFLLNPFLQQVYSQQLISLCRLDRSGIDLPCLLNTCKWNMRCQYLTFLNNFRLIALISDSHEGNSQKFVERKSYQYSSYAITICVRRFSEAKLLLSSIYSDINISELGGIAISISAIT